MTYASRYQRPSVPRSSLHLQERDLAILNAAHVHRFVVSHHIRELLFPGVSLWRAQHRLRKLWEHRLLDRYFAPAVLRTGIAVPQLSPRPIYALTARGAACLAEASSGRATGLHTALRLKARSRPTFEHHLVVTDFMVALRVALETESRARIHRLEHEHVLWPHVLRLPPAARKRGVIVPDGAITLDVSNGQRITLYLEVVRAGPPGGNKTVREKLARYAELHHQGFFKSLYGHERLRAVVFATTSEVRAERFCSFAAGLPHGRRLFWFGSYASPSKDTRSGFTPTSILTHLWQTAVGAGVTLGDVITSEAHA